MSDVDEVEGSDVSDPVRGVVEFEDEAEEAEDEDDEEEEEEEEEFP